MRRFLRFPRISLPGALDLHIYGGAVLACLAVGFLTDRWEYALLAFGLYMVFLGLRPVRKPPKG